MENKVLNDFEIENNMVMKYLGDGGDVVIPEGVSDIFFEVFEYRGDSSSVTIPGSITLLTPFVFKGSTLKTVNINKGVGEIGVGTFAECDKLETIYLPETITGIKKYAFEKCSSLKTIYYAGNEKRWGLIRKEKDWDKEIGKYTIVFDYK